jgi:integrase
LPVDEIRRYHIMDFKYWRKKHSLVAHKTKVSARAVNFSISVLSVFLNWAIERELYTRFNPTSNCKDSEDNFRHVILTPDQIGELLSKAKGKSDWLYTGIMLALFAGLRRQEVLELKWGDIDFLNSLICLRAAATKSKKQRMIPLPDILEEQLSRLTKYGEYVISDIEGKVAKDKFYHRWEKLRDSLSFAKLPNGLSLTFHDLRHVYAQSLRDAGINLGDIQAYMGHSSVEMTIRRYAQRGGVNGKEKVNKLADVYNIH